MASAIITLLRLERDVLIFLVSSNRCPVEPDSFNLSEPAKSTRLRLPVQFSPVLSLEPWIFNMNTEWERELLSLQLVAATARAFFALLSNWSMLCPLVTSSVYKTKQNNSLKIAIMFIIYCLISPSTKIMATVIRNLVH